MIGRAIGADRLQRQFGEALLDFGALDLEDRAFRPRPLARLLARERAQFGDFERSEIDLELAHLLGKIEVLDQRCAIKALVRGDLAQLFDAALRTRHTGNA